MTFRNRGNFVQNKEQSTSAVQSKTVNANSLNKNILSFTEFSRCSKYKIFYFY